MIAAAATPPRISPGVSNTAGRPPTTGAAATATTTPASMARPPAAGVGVSWMWWASGARLAPIRTATLVVSGTSRNVATAATAPTMAKDSTDGTAGA